MASEYESSVIEGLEYAGVIDLEVFTDRCEFGATTQRKLTHTLTREQMYKLSDEIRIIADGMEFLTCDGSENE